MSLGGKIPSSLGGQRGIPLWFAVFLILATLALGIICTIALVLILRGGGQATQGLPPTRTPVPTPTVMTAAERQYIEAQQYFQRGQYQECLNTLAQLQEAQPTYAPQKVLGLKCQASQKLIEQQELLAVGDPAQLTQAQALAEATFLSCPEVAEERTRLAQYLTGEMARRQQQWLIAITNLEPVAALRPSHPLGNFAAAALYDAYVHYADSIVQQDRASAVSY